MTALSVTDGQREAARRALAIIAGAGSATAAHNGFADDLRAARLDGAALLDDLVAFVRRFVHMSRPQAHVAALFVVHAHTLDAVEATPYLSVTSAEKRSGKTRLLEVLELLVPRPWLTGRVTAAVLARKVDAEAPTLLLDESDAAFKSGDDYAEALRGLLNTGHRRGGKATVCVGQGASIGYRDFATFCPKVIAGIGDLPPTIADRAFPIRLERRAPGEPVERFRRRKVHPEATALREQVERFAAASLDSLTAAEPALPDALDDRGQDAAEPLLAIADLAGGEWPERARRAVVELRGGHVEDESVGVRLLADVRQVFGDEDRIATATLLDRLAALDEAPWGEWYGRTLTSRGLAKLLRPYRIGSRTVRLEHGDGRRAKGFHRADFEPAWARYLPVYPCQGDNPHSRAKNGPSASVTAEPLSRQEISRNPAWEAECHVVTDGTPDTGEGTAEGRSE